MLLYVVGACKQEEITSKKNFSPDGSYQKHLHRQIKWAISLKTICMFPVCYESALCQANSLFLNAQNIMRGKKRPYFSSLVHDASIKRMSAPRVLQPRALRLSPCVLICFLYVFFSGKKDIILIHIWGHLSHHFLFL